MQLIRFFFFIFFNCFTISSSSTIDFLILRTGISVSSSIIILKSFWSSSCRFFCSSSDLSLIYSNRLRFKLLFVYSFNNLGIHVVFIKIDFEGKTLREIQSNFFRKVQFRFIQEILLRGSGHRRPTVTKILLR